MAFLRRIVTTIGRRLSLAAALVLAIGGLSLGGLGVGGLGAGAAAATVSRAVPAPLVVPTDKGLVRGLDTATAREFFGIPYAAPPVGNLRWQPPQPARPWAGVRDSVVPNNCAQLGAPDTGVLNTSTSEDCLYLNVYTPTTASARPLPVMVWIHGGGFTGGAGSIYDGAELASKGHVIVVTINYRLGAFGYLDLPGLTRGSGDYGLLDQQAALRWVQRNALFFGGDPRDVTEFGESAGAASVCDNMASPSAAGLFRHAIAESGCLLSAPTVQGAQAQGTALAATLGCTDAATQVACMRGKPVTDILGAADGDSWAPVTGTPTLPQPTAAAFADGRYNHVPLLQGTNHDEGRFFVAFGFDLAGHPLTAAQYPQLIQSSYGANAAAVLAQYPLSAYASPDLAYAAILTDTLFSCPALEADQLTARSGGYAYEFSDPNPPDDFGFTTLTFPLGAAHSTEIQYVFQRVPLLDTPPTFTSAQLALSDQMIAYWTRFAATGDPNAGHPGAARTPFWPGYTTYRPDIQELVPGATAPETAAQFSAAHKCGFWASL
jgi:para-nitrobenzyl esterase